MFRSAIMISMKAVLTIEKMRDIDRNMIEKAGIPGSVLMENAANAVALAAMEKLKPSGSRCVILIGPGNNGGDGLAVLRILSAHGYSAVGIILADPDKYSGDAAINYQTARQLGLELTEDIESVVGADVIIDAVFGTGLCREITGKHREAILLANRQDAYRIAVDIPSGINGDTGEIMGVVFHADLTVTMFALKRGLLLTKELEAVGSVRIAHIGIPTSDILSSLEDEQLIDEAFVRSLLPKRRLVSNKGSYGRALIFAGSTSMPGAALMCARAALRAGSGLTKACVPDDIVPFFSASPEIMVLSGSANSLNNQLDWATAIGIGCGMGNDPDRREKLRSVLLSGKPAVIDADGLNTLDDELKQLLNANHVLTPHPGEMARLTGLSVAAVLSDPVGTASAFSKQYGCCVVLKNAVSVIVSPDGKIRYNRSGNPGLAKGGSGDVLTGIITAFLANGLSPFDAASAGAFLLGSTAETALSVLAERALTATDIIDLIGSDLNS